MAARLKIFRKVIILILAFFVLHLIVITLFDPFNFKEKINTRHKIYKLEEYYHRGDIYDRNGNLLATTQYVYQLDLLKGLIHKRVNNEQQESRIFDLYSRIFCEYTRYDTSRIATGIKKSEYSSIFLGDNLLISQINNITSKIKLEVKKDSILGISVNQAVTALKVTRLSERRIYPYERLAPRLLGLAVANTVRIQSPDENGEKGVRFQHLKGRCGMEKTFEKYLRGENGWQEIICDANGDKILKPSLKSQKPVHGEDVYLTINIRYQEILEEKLHEGLLKYKAKNAMGVIMDVHTGEILALTGEQENDQNLDTAILRTYSNLPVSCCMEPGSTMKPITAILALEKNLYESDELIDCSPLKFDYGNKNRTIRDHHNLDKLTLEGVIVESSNPGISRVAIKVGKEALNERLIEMGLGRQTLSDIYGENKGIFRNKEDWTEYSLCSISFGQEISLNMLHLAVIYAAFANQGKILQPNILYYTEDQYGNINNQLEPKIFRTISQPVFIKQIQKFLRNVVKKGTAKDADLDFIEISGKTGTSEIITVNSEGKVETRHNSLFAGYLPSNDPQIVIIVAFDRCIEDENQYYFASQSAVPTFKEVVKNILILPECDLVTSSVSSQEDIAILPNLIGMEKQQAIKVLKDLKLDYSFVNSLPGGIISDQYPPANIRFNKKQAVKLAIALPGVQINDEKLMPDFTGMTLREAFALARTRLINITASGNGVVKTQSIIPQTEISLEDVCHISLN